jgi:glycosyltransferase involved in cell wall biosynthesis
VCRGARWSPSASETCARSSERQSDGRAGLPIVITRIRGAVDHLEAGENALFVELRDTTALESAIKNLLDNGELRDRMSSADRARVARFDPKVVAREYLQVLQSLASRDQSRGGQGDARDHAYNR